MTDDRIPWGELLAIIQRMSATVAIKMNVDQAELEDLVCLLVIRRVLDGGFEYRTPGEAGSFIRGLASRVACHMLRAAKCRKRHNQEYYLRKYSWTDYRQLACAADALDTEIDRTDPRDASEALDLALLNACQDELDHIIRSGRRSDKSNGEIAAAINQSPNFVAQRWCRIIERAREAAQGQGGKQ